MAYRAIIVGLGGMGEVWCRHILPQNIKDGQVEIVAAAEINPERLRIAQEALGLSEKKCYTDPARAMGENAADFCIIVTPPDSHEEIVDLALANDLHILSEKPIADTLEASCRIAEKVKRAGKKMGVTMSHRFDQDKTTLREELRSGKHGPIDYMTCRFTNPYRAFGAWGKFRHEMRDALMIEGAVHHLDFLVDMAGAGCETIYAQTWNPRWGEYAGDSQALVMLRCANGVRIAYEAAKTNAVGLNGWGQEYIRAECERATLILDRRRLEKFVYDPARPRVFVREGEGEEIPPIQQPKWTNAWLTEKFVRWLDGGEKMETNVEDNLQSVALVFAAIRSSRLREPVSIQEILASTRRRVCIADEDTHWSTAGV